jgi:hypothetical protein
MLICPVVQEIFSSMLKGIFLFIDTTTKAHARTHTHTHTHTHTKELLKGDLLFDWFGISCVRTDNFSFHSQNRLIQSHQTGGQQYSDTSPFGIPIVTCNNWIYNFFLHFYSIQQSHCYERIYWRYKSVCPSYWSGTQFHNLVALLLKFSLFL